MSTPDPAQLQQLTARLADVELPPPADWNTVYLISALAILLPALLAALYSYRHRRRPDSHRPPADLNREAQTRLQLLQRQWQAGEINEKEAAYRLATLLRLGNTPLDDRTNDPQWQRLTAALDELRYRPTPNQCLDPELFAIARLRLEGAKQC